MWNNPNLQQQQQQQGPFISGYNPGAQSGFMTLPATINQGRDSPMFKNYS
jgi:hypothetical protein